MPKRKAAKRVYVFNRCKKLRLPPVEELMTARKYNRKNRRLKSQFDLSPLCIMLNRVVHCLANKNRGQSIYKPTGLFPFRTITEMKNFYRKGIRRGLRANPGYVMALLSTALTLDEGEFVEKLYGGLHDELFDNLYDLSICKPRTVAILFNSIINTPATHIKEDFIYSNDEDGENLFGDELQPDMCADPNMSWFPTLELLIGKENTYERIHVGKERTPEQWEKHKGAKAERDEVVRGEALANLMHCMRAFHLEG